MPRAVALCLIPLLLSSPAVAQSTRAETIANQQAEKAKTLAVEGPSEAEVIVRRVLASPFLSSGDGLYPWFGSVFGGTGMAIGAGYLKRLENAASITVLGGVSLNNSILIETRLAAPELWRGRVRVDLDATWIDARGVSFYGFGPASEKRSRLRYDYQPTDVAGQATFRPLARLALVGGYSFATMYTAGSSPGPFAESGPGLGERLRYDVTRASVVFDWRSSPGYSTRGGFYRGTWERHDEANHRPFSFDSQEYEVVQLLPLVREQFVLAARGLVTMTRPDAGHEVPVMLAPFLGSGTTLRGFATRRFADRNRVLLTGEYRWRPSRYVDMALFIDAGQVTADKHQFRVRDFETSWGIGARIHGPTFTAIRVEVARSRDGLGLVVAGSQVF